MESLNLNTYLEGLKNREKKTSAKTRIAEIVEPYLREWNWTNETFKADMQGLWVAVYRYMKSHTDVQLKSILEWSCGKSVHCRGMIKILRK